MIIWSGWGVLAPIGTFILLIITELSTEYFFDNEQYYQQHEWPALVAFIISGIMCWFLGNELNKARPSGYLDEETEGEVMITPNHTFFFIPLQFWAFLFPVLGVISVLNR